MKSMGNVCTPNSHHAHIKCGILLSLGVQPALFFLKRDIFEQFSSLRGFWVPTHCDEYSICYLLTSLEQTVASHILSQDTIFPRAIIYFCPYFCCSIYYSGQYRIRWNHLWLLRTRASREKTQNKTH